MRDPGLSGRLSPCQAQEGYLQRYVWVLGYSAWEASDFRHGTQPIPPGRIA
jgi:hypothetical protein